MKKLIILLLVCFAISFSQAPINKLRLKSNVSGSTADITIDSAKVVGSQLVIYLASGGFFTVDSSTITRIGGVVDYTSIFSMKGRAGHADFIELFNEDGTKKYGVDSTGTPSVGSVHAVRDSFTTTLQKDTVVMAGASATDLFLVTQITTLASSAPDSGCVGYNAFFLNTDSVVVQRTPKDILGSAPKSAAIFDLFRYKKH